MPSSTDAERRRDTPAKAHESHSKMLGVEPPCGGTSVARYTRRGPLLHLRCADVRVDRKAWASASRVTLFVPPDWFNVQDGRAERGIQAAVRDDTSGGKDSTPARAYMIDASRMEPPTPPYASGVVIASIPCSPALCHSSRETIPSASHLEWFGTTSVSHHRRHDSRNISVNRITRCTGRGDGGVRSPPALCWL